MAEDIEPQKEIVRSLHLRILRKQWQIITLQVIATVAAIWMYLELVGVYIADSIDHVILIEIINQQLASANAELPLPDWITGQGSEGTSRFYGPVALGALFGGGLSALTFQTPDKQRKIRLGLMALAFAVIAGPFLVDWIFGQFNGWHWPTLQKTDEYGDAEIDALLESLILIFELILLMAYVLPVILGIRGIWGLSRTAIGWTIGLVLVFIAIHAILTFQLINEFLFRGNDGLQSLDTLVGDANILGLINDQQLSLVLISVLLLVFQESAYGVIRYLEYAFRLPESCKKDPEYVRQFHNLLNGHILHTSTFMLITAFATMIALRFHALLLGMVDSLSGSQWASQVQESLELELTYGLIISAVLFLIFMTGLRFVIPWQRVSGFVENLYAKRNNQ